MQLHPRTRDERECLFQSHCLPFPMVHSHSHGNCHDPLLLLSRTSCSVPVPSCCCSYCVCLVACPFMYHKTPMGIPNIIILISTPNKNTKQYCSVCGLKILLLQGSYIKMHHRICHFQAKRSRIFWGGVLRPPLPDLSPFSTSN